MTGAVVTCVHAGRRVKKNRQKRHETTVQGTDTRKGKGEGGGPRVVQKKNRQNYVNTPIQIF